MTCALLNAGVLEVPGCAAQFFRGMYSVYLRVWFRFFPRESFLIIKSSDYFADAEATLK